MPTTPRPQLVLRIGLVGTRHLTSVPAVLASLERSVELVVEAACDELAATHRSGAYSGDAPLLRMVSGLAEGSDALGTRVFERTCSRMTSSFGIRHETAAILPFDIASYRTSRGESFRADFDELLSRCAYALTITGEWARGADDRTARARESKAHRAQSQLLLRQVDIVLAIADPMAEAKAGGTIETVREALAGGLTVLFIDALHGAIRHLRHADELVSVDLATSKATSVDRPLIGQAIRSIIGPPGRESKSAADRGSLLLDEYFGPHDPTAARTNISRLRAAAWNAARSPLKPAGTTVAGVEEDGRHVAAWRDRANALCNWYTDEYRGAFSLNYIVAVIAVLLAAVAVLTVGFSAGAHGAHAPTEGDGHSITIPLILAMLGAAKLVLLLLISTNTRDARAGKWNRRAVNYRYFLERLPSRARLLSPAPRSSAAVCIARREPERDGVALQRDRAKPVATGPSQDGRSRRRNTGAALHRPGVWTHADPRQVDRFTECVSLGHGAKVRTLEPNHARDDRAPQLGRRWACRH
jgi:hypothetical protein